MSTTGKTSIRKDKNYGIGSVFEERDAKKEELAKAEIAEIKENPPVKEEKAEKKATENAEKGRGVKKNSQSPKQKSVSSLFAKEEKKRFQQKSVYLSTENVEFVKRQSDAHGIAFSEVLNRIIDNFKENL